MPRTGLPAAHPVPTRLKHLVTAGRSKAGSGLPPMLVTSARTRCTFKFSELTPASRALLLSQTGGRHRTQCLVSLLRRLAYGSHCRWRCAGVAVAVSLTPCATSGVLATRALPLSTLLRVSAARLARGSLAMSGSPTWTGRGQTRPGVARADEGAAPTCGSNLNADNERRHRRAGRAPG